MYFFEDVNAFGCPHCGYRSHSHPIQQGPFISALCNGEGCGKQFVIYCGELQLPPTWNGSDKWGGSPMVMERHQRTGTPSHGRPDTRPDGGGEHWWPRGVGKEWNLGCIVCGEETGPKDDLWNNVAAFVQTKEAGERVVAMFKQGARLDYRESSPDRIQVKVGACDGHLPRLHELCRLEKAIRQEDVDRITAP